MFTLFYEHSDLRLLCVVVIWIFDGKRQKQPHATGSCLSEYKKAPGIQHHQPRGTPENFIDGFFNGGLYMYVYRCFSYCTRSKIEV